MGESAPDEDDMSDCLREFDKDKDGELNKEEFVTFVQAILGHVLFKKGQQERDEE